MRYDLVIRNGMVATPNGIEALDIGVKDGRVAALGSLTQADTATVFDANGLTVLPGVIDTQVHFREPGQEHKEDLATGTAAAAMGGVTAVFEMPNTKPSTATAAELADKVQRGLGRTHCDFAFYAGATAENVEMLPELEKLPGCAGVKLFMGASTGDLLVADDATLERVLRHGKRRMAVHCEDEYRMRERKHLTEAPGATAHLHPEWRDAESALLATQRLVRLARKTGRRVHVLHVTTAQEMAFLASHKDIASVETTPQHLTLAAPDCYDRLGTLAQMNPPIRSAEHRAALWEAVRNGVVDVIGSDHAPHTRDEKAKPYPQSPSGMPGVQTLLPLLLDHMNQGRLTLQRLIDLTSAGAQRIFGLTAKGRIALGYDADFTVVDLKAKKTIEESWLKSKCGWSPFTGMSVTGWPMATIVRGQFAMRDGELGQPIGRPLRFGEALQPEG
ncbi:dihydroorotase [Ferrovibrio sp.]|uniref:dihydroorotase n=1 Tax=Ferrovibrio sp. TaxID=1917215 RepID=UPI00263A20FE|nr:dihydroorotase [Ferrovibrio sp.]